MGKCTLPVLHGSLCVLSVIKIFPRHLMWVMQDIVPPTVKAFMGKLAKQDLSDHLAFPTHLSPSLPSSMTMDNACLADLEQESLKSLNLAMHVVALPEKENAKKRKREHPQPHAEESKGKRKLKEVEKVSVPRRTWKALTGEMRDVLLAHQPQFTPLQREKVRDQLLTLLSIVDQ